MSSDNGPSIEFTNGTGRVALLGDRLLLVDVGGVDVLDGLSALELRADSVSLVRHFVVDGTGTAAIVEFGAQPRLVTGGLVSAEVSVTSAWIHVQPTGVDVNTVELPLEAHRVSVTLDDAPTRPIADIDGRPAAPRWQPLTTSVAPADGVLVSFT